MAYLPTGAQARERAQNNNVIAQQIAIMEVAVLDAIASNANRQFQDATRNPLNPAALLSKFANSIENVEVKNVEAKNVETSQAN